MPPSPIGNMWHIEDVELTVTWMTRNPAPESVLQVLVREASVRLEGVHACLQKCLVQTYASAKIVKMYLSNGGLLKLVVKVNKK